MLARLRGLIYTIESIWQALLSVYPSAVITKTKTITLSSVSKYDLSHKWLKSRTSANIFAMFWLATLNDICENAFGADQPDPTPCSLLPSLDLSKCWPSRTMTSEEKFFGSSRNESASLPWICDEVELCWFRFMKNRDSGSSDVLNKLSWIGTGIFPIHNSSFNKHIEGLSIPGSMFWGINTALQRTRASRVTWKVSGTRWTSRTTDRFRRSLPSLLAASQFMNLAPELRLASMEFRPVCPINAARESRFVLFVLCYIFCIFRREVAWSSRRRLWIARRWYSRNHLWEKYSQLSGS